MQKVKVQRYVAGKKWAFFHLAWVLIGSNFRPEFADVHSSGPEDSDQDEQPFDQPESSSHDKNLPNKSRYGDVEVKAEVLSSGGG